jgi:tRNA(fMet)-specific endonuclease VapC
MIVLDTDHISLLQHPDSPEAEGLARRLSASADRDVVTSVVTLEEQMRSWLAAIARHKDLERQAEYYERLVGFTRFFEKWRILAFDDAAIVHFRRQRKAKVRIATTDLKIAAITLAKNATLLSRNLKDFREVQGLRVEDWSGPDKP